MTLYKEHGLHYKPQYSLNSEQKYAVGVLSVGTFLEYFDLMLYVHMATLLNDIFFPKTDPEIKKLLSAATFCTTYVFRPFGAMFFGWVGDTIGRKYTVYFTTIIMSFSCLAMATMPTYEDIGIKASWGMLTCRTLQGLSSMGEVVGALIYLTEFVKLPARYFAVATIPIFCGLGGFAALGVASFMLKFEAGWRYAFGFGALIAIVGVVARATLRETPDFVDAKRMLTKDAEKKLGLLKKRPTKKTSFSLFFMECLSPLCFYFGFVYCGDLLRIKFDYSAMQVIHHNFFIALIDAFGALLKLWLCKYFHPFLILRIILIKTAIVFCFAPFWIEYATLPFFIGLLQLGVLFMSADVKFASGAIYTNFPVFYRFRSAALLYASSRAFMYIGTSFGMILVVKYMGNYGLSFALMVVMYGGWWGLKHFLELEKDRLTLQKEGLPLYSEKDHVASEPLRS
jgi:MHS family proline/betaine transporter-like MFS transporter